MTDLNQIKKIYFIGIGGIGMSALARYFRLRGKEVSGYDKTETVLTKELIKEGIPVSYEDEIRMIPGDVELIVYTPAIPGDHKGFRYYSDHGYLMLKRSEVLGLITASSLNICVAGTHGKTTVSTMTAFILRDSGYGCNAFLGGISVNYNTNFWSDQRNVSVVEADEYDRSFLKLDPDIAVITSMDADHLDIYGTAEAVRDAFRAFARKIRNQGSLFSKYGLKTGDGLKDIQQIRYALNESAADLYAENIRIESGSYVFNVKGTRFELMNLRLNIGGRHNIENALPAIGIAKRLGIADEKIKKAISAFRGVKRRFEYILPPDETTDEQNSMVYIDDYAHHPRELSALIGSAKELFPGYKCIVIFQPHLFTRTRDFAEGFAESLDLADAVMLMPIYPAREKPIEGINSTMILNKMKMADKRTGDREQILNWVKEIDSGKQPVLLITAGAGDIDMLVQPVKKIIEEKKR